MQPRIDFYTASPEALKAMLALETAVSRLPLEKSLIELVKQRPGRQPVADFQRMGPQGQEAEQQQRPTFHV